MRKRKVYRGARGPSYLDRPRGRLVPVSEEERVRQDTVDWLVRRIGIPEEYIRTELHLMRGYGFPGRADIVVLKDAGDEKSGAVLVVECKRPGKALFDEKTRKQLHDYASALDASWAMFTCGETETRVAQRRIGKKYCDVVRLPRWSGLQKRIRVPLTPRHPFDRWDYGEIACACKARATLKARDLDWHVLGEESPGMLAPFVANLFGFLADDRRKSLASPKRRGKLRLVQDLGRKARWFDNSAGGSWPSDYYRSFLVRWGGIHYTVSVALLAQEKMDGSKSHFGTSRGSTALVVAVDHGSQSRVSLELKLDKSLRLRNSLLELTHDGLMTIGQHGRTPRDRVMHYLQRVVPDLIVGGEVSLGKVPIEQELNWGNAGAFLMNLLRYAVARDRLKERIIGPI